MATIYVPDVGTTLASLVSKLNDRLRDFIVFRDLSLPLTTVNTIQLPDNGIIESTLVVTVDTFIAQDTILSEGGWLYIGAALPQTSLRVQYHAKYWNDTMLEEFINSAIGELYPAVYLRKEYTGLSVSENVYEYLLPDDLEEVTRVEVLHSVSPNYRTYDGCWHITTSTPKRLVFHQDIDPGTLRVSYVARPDELDTADTLEGNGIPTRFIECILLKGESLALSECIIPRILEDRGKVNMNNQYVRVYEMVNAASHFENLYQIKLQRVKMKRFQSRKQS